MIELKRVENSKGMALVTVLFTIVIFSILGLTLFNFTISNAKQISKTEEDMKAVDIAEMGIIRYKNQIILHIDTLLASGISKAIASIEHSNSTSTTITPINGTTILNEMQANGWMPSSDKFLLGISSADKFDAFPGSTMYYKLNELPPTFVTYPKILQLEFISTGSTLDKNAEVKGTVTINIEKLIDDSLTPGTPGTPGLHYSVVKPSVTIQTPHTTKSCNSSNKLEHSCNYNNNISTNIKSHSNIHAIINGKLEITGNNTSISDSHLLIKNDIDIKGTDVIENSRIFSKQSGTFGNVKDGLVNSTLYFGKDVNFDNMNGNGKINNSTIFTENKTTFGNINGGINKSIIFSGNDIEFGQLNSPIKDTVIYGDTNAYFKNGNSGFLNSTLYVENNLTFKNINGEINNSQIITNGLATFENINHPISNSTLYFDNATLGHINASITNTKIYVLNDITTDHVNGNISSNSLICVGGTISGGLATKENGVNIISKTKYPVEYAKNCSPTSTGGTPSTLKDLVPELVNIIDKTKIDYN